MGKILVKTADGWQQLLTWCEKVNNTEQLSSLLELLLTHDEKVDISKRCLIIRELLANEQNQREIAKNLNVSIAKITRGSNELKRMDAKLLEFIKNCCQAD